MSNVTSLHLPAIELERLRGEAGGISSGTELYYSFDYADIHFVCLDSQTSGNYAAALGTGMYAWLESDLMATSQNWIIAYFHHGPYTKGSHDSDNESRHIETRNKATMLLEDYGVGLVLYGHSHCYERSMLIDGHYGTSGTFDPMTMAIDTGNGSEVGGVDLDAMSPTFGDFLPGEGDGAYEKPLGSPNEGAVYITAGSSGKLSNWNDSSSGLVNPNPHPVMIVKLRLLGSMVLDVSANQLHARFLVSTGLIRDDFTILKGSTINLLVLDGAAGEFGPDATAEFQASRTGAVGLPLTASYSVGGSASNPADYTPSLSGMVHFEGGQINNTITITRVTDALVEGAESVIPSLVPDAAYLLGGSVSAVATIEDKPSDAWRFGFFGGSNPAESGWFEDGDGDLVSTLLEYGLGGDPTVAEWDLLPTMVSDGAVLKLICQRDNALADLIYRVKRSSNLAGWTEAGVADNFSGPPNPLGIEMREATIPIGAGPEFLRLELELQP